MEGHDDHAPGAVGDNYPAYVRDHFGYHYDAQEWMAREERAFLIELESRHDVEALEPYFKDLKQYNSLQLVHLLHRHLRLIPQYTSTRALELIEECLTRPSYHGAVHYEELAEQGIMMALELGEQDRAARFFELCEALPEHTWPRALFFKAILSWHDKDTSTAQTLWLTHAQHDAETVDVERLYEAVEWLASKAPESEDRLTIARTLATHLGEAARRQGARDVLVDLELLDLLHD